MSLAYPLADRALAQRLERAEGSACRSFVEARARLIPESRADWIEIAGAYAMFDGVRSPITQTFGLGMFAPAAAMDLDRIEAFYADRGAPVLHEVSPLADKELFPLLTQRHYQPIEFSSVTYLPIGRSTEAPRADSRIRVRVVGESEHDLWARVSAQGWADSTEFLDTAFELFRISAARTNGFDFLAELEGEPVAAGGLCIHDGVALLSGACTIPSARRLGAQGALLEARLRYAAESGCDLAMMGAEPGSSSQRNAERQGFRIAYTRVKWELRASTAPPAANP